ncbi:MAG TPA: hypothetical protein VFH56_03840 [Acidimicrobiales bacterium]|nr:hypothetical protein [Acidimicrobiales bacterium]
MRLTNDCYLITMRVGAGVERYYRQGEGWVKVTTRGRVMPATAEQVLNHLLPALAGVKPNVGVEVEHRDLSGAAKKLLAALREPPEDQ